MLIDPGCRAYFVGLIIIVYSHESPDWLLPGYCRNYVSPVLMMYNVSARIGIMNIFYYCINKENLNFFILVFHMLVMKSHGSERNVVISLLLPFASFFFFFRAGCKQTYTNSKRKRMDKMGTDWVFLINIQCRFKALRSSNFCWDRRCWNQADW